MPIQLQIGPIIGSLAPASVGVETLLQHLRGRGTREAQALADALYELQMGIATLEAILRQVVPVEGDGILLLNERGELADTFERGRLHIQDPTGGGAQVDILADATPAAVVQGQVGNAIGLLLVNNTGAMLVLTDNAGGTQAELDGITAQLRIGGQQVVGTRKAAVAAITQTAGATYTATEQAMMNAMKASLNDLINKLSAGTGHGLLG
jgi:hypothetical protein